MSRALLVAAVVMLAGCPGEDAGRGGHPVAALRIIPSVIEVPPGGRVCVEVDVAGEGLPRSLTLTSEVGTWPWGAAADGTPLMSPAEAYGCDSGFCYAFLCVTGVMPGFFRVDVTCPGALIFTTARVEVLAPAG